MAWRGVAGLGEAGLGLARRGEARYMARRGSARLGWARRGRPEARNHRPTWRGEAGQGAAGRGEARYVVDLTHIEMCSLQTWRHRCSGGYHLHHIVSRGKLRGNPAARRFAEREHPEIFLARVCAAANVSRLADTDEAQAILMAGKITLFGRAYVDEVWAEFADLWVVRPRLEGILFNLPEDAPRPVV